MVNNISIVSRVYQNVRKIIKFTHPIGKTESETTRLWLNLNTGELRTHNENQSPKQWKKVMLMTTGDSYYLDIKKKVIAKEATAAVKATVAMLNTVAHQIKEQKKMDHLPTLSEILQEYPEKRLQVLNEIMEKVAFIFGQEEFKTQPSTLKELAQEVFRLVNEQLEGVQPITEKDVKAIFDLLFRTVLEKECQNRDKSHISTIIYQLHDAMSYCKKVGKENALVPTAGKKGKFLGANSSYFLLGNKTQRLWVFKPVDGESGYQDKKVLFDGITPGKQAKREHVAHLLNIGHIYPIPFTAYISLGGQVGSVQQFESGTVSYGALETDIVNIKQLLKIPLKPMQSMVIYDIRFGNCDSHGGNILCRPIYESGKILTGYEVFGIDHGGSMTSSEKDPLKMTYLLLSQLIRSPIDDELKKFILKDMNIERDAILMKKHGIPDKAILWMRNASNFLRLALDLSEESLKSGNNEMMASDIGFFALARRDLIWKFDEKREDVETHLLDILFCKNYLSDLKLRKILSKGRVLRLKRSIFNRSRGQREEIWMKCLFDNIVENFFNHIS